MKNDDLISRSELRARFQVILDRGDMFCEYDIVGMVDNAQPVDVERLEDENHRNFVNSQHIISLLIEENKKLREMKNV
jgi:hypothetical protein